MFFVCPPAAREPTSRFVLRAFVFNRRHLYSEARLYHFARARAILLLSPRVFYTLARR